MYNFAQQFEMQDNSVKITESFFERKYNQL